VDLIAALQSFLRVSQTGSFSAVATERGVTQPAVSRQVTALEEYLGTRLFHRSTQAVALTEEGHEFISAAHKLLEDAEALQNAVGRRRGKPIGKVRVAVPIVLGLYLSERFGPLLDEHQELSIDLVLRDGGSDFIEEGLDLEVRLGPMDDSAMITRQIGQTTSYLVATSEYL
jgi:DNA-binding transcriptional LysR family regulator